MLLCAETQHPWVLEHESHAIHKVAFLHISALKLIVQYGCRVMNIVCFFALRFFSRESGTLKFRLHTGLPARGGVHPTKRLVAYIFHPHEPFAISIQKAEFDYVVNLYFRNSQIL